MRRADPHRLLLAAIRHEIAGSATIAEASARAWASATYTGTRHLVELALAADAAEALGRRLEAIEYRLAGHLVADLTATTHPAGLRIEALTIEAH